MGKRNISCCLHHNLNIVVYVTCFTYPVCRVRQRSETREIHLKYEKTVLATALRTKQKHKHAFLLDLQLTHSTAILAFVH